MDAISRPQALFAGLLLAALIGAAPRPGAALWTLLAAGDPASGEPMTALIAAVALAAWALVSWLGSVSALLLLSRVPGAAGSFAGRIARRAAPAVVRRSLQAALGLGVSVSVLVSVAAPAAADHGGLHTHVGTPISGVALPLPAVAGEPLSLDWPQASRPAPLAPPAPPRGATDLDWPQAASRPGAQQHVTVRPGDSLWRLAAEQLPAGATTTRIARTWPTWWEANRAAIGTDPDLLHPGTRLVVPHTP